MRKRTNGRRVARIEHDRSKYWCFVSLVTATYVFRRMYACWIGGRGTDGIYCLRPFNVHEALTAWLTGCIGVKWIPSHALDRVQVHKNRDRSRRRTNSFTHTIRSYSMYAILRHFADKMAPVSEDSVQVQVHCYPFSDVGRERHNNAYTRSVPPPLHL